MTDGGGGRVPFMKLAPRVLVGYWQGCYSLASFGLGARQHIKSNSTCRAGASAKEFSSEMGVLMTAERGATLP